MVHYDWSLLFPGIRTATCDVFCRWTTGYGEKYDYDSIMHYSKTAFSKSTTDMTIVPKFTDPDLIGKKVNLSETDIIKIKKLYKCAPYDQW